MKTLLLCAALGFVVWTAPARADEICVGPACVGNGEHRDRDRDRDQGRELREHRDRVRARVVAYNGRCMRPVTKVGGSVNTATLTKVGSTVNTATLTKVGRNADPAIEETRRSTRFKVSLDTISRLERRGGHHVRTLDDLRATSWRLRFQNAKRD